MSKQPPTRTYCKGNRPLPYYHPNCRTPRHWKFTQNHHNTRPPPSDQGPHCLLTGISMQNTVKVKMSTKIPKHLTGQKSARQAGIEIYICKISKNVLSKPYYIENKKTTKTANCRSGSSYYEPPHLDLCCLQIQLLICIVIFDA